MMSKNNYGFVILPPMKDKYSTSEWELRESEYIASINSISIPTEPDDKDITSLNSFIDSVYTVAKIEQAIYSRRYDRNYQRRKNSETEVYVIIKDGNMPDANGNKAKMTEAEIKAKGVQYLRNSAVTGTSLNVYELESMTADRKIFMDSVVDILRSKSDKLITAAGALKLAVQINQSNVPRLGN